MIRTLVATILALLLLNPICAAAPFLLQWNKAAGFIELRGLDLRALEALGQWNADAPDWSRLLRIEVRSSDLLAAVNHPAVAGHYSIDRSVLLYKPLFPFTAGTPYTATFQPRYLPQPLDAPPVIVHFELESPARQPSTIVRQIYPTAPVLPENLLKFYLHFSASMSGGHIYDHIALLNEQGQPVELPFLEIDEELWNPDMTRLTLFLDPGRIKRGVKPLEEIGPSLVEGQAYTLLIRASWPDATGTPLASEYRKPFRVGPPDRAAILPESWQILPPAANSRAPLSIRFGESLDHALALRLIQISDHSGLPIPGAPLLRDHESVWTFTPDVPWPSRSIILSLPTNLEDLAGNNIGKPFEVDLFDGVDRRLTNSVTKIPVNLR